MSGVALVVTVAWCALVLAAAWAHGPRPTRRPPGPARAEGPAGPLTRLGAGLRRTCGRPPDPAADRAVGRAVAATPALVAFAPALLPVAWGAALLAPRLAVRRRARPDDEAWAAAVPEAVDLFGLALASGLTVPGALTLVAPRAPPPLGPALATAEQRFGHGEPLDRALARVAEAGPAARPLVAVLVAAHCDGAPAAEPLGRLADELRRAHQRRAEARSRQVPVRMLFPLVGCTLPAFVLVTVVPAVVAALGDLQR